MKVIVSRMLLRIRWRKGVTPSVVASCSKMKGKIFLEVFRLLSLYVNLTYAFVCVCVCQ